MRKQLSNYTQRAAGSLALFLGLASGWPALATDLNPQLVGSYKMNFSHPNHDYFRIHTVSGTRAYGTTDVWDSVAIEYVQSLVILDIANPRSPTWLGSLKLRYLVWPNIVIVRGNYAYAPAGGDGLVIIDVSDPSAPRRVGGYNTSGGATGVFLSGNYAYVADGGAGLVVIDISNPASPRRVGGLDAAGEARQVVVSGNYAYLADRFWNGIQNDIQEFGALRIIDISDPASPQLVGEIPTEGMAWRVGVVGNVAYVGAKELQMFNISDPANPTHIGNYNTTWWGGALPGSRAYTVSGDFLDISNPASPRRLGGYTPPDEGFVSGVAVEGQYAYLGIRLGAGAGLAVIDLDPVANLPRVGSLDTAGYARDVAVSGTRAYVADDTAGMQILDIANPQQPLPLGNYPTAYPAEMVVANGNRAHVVESWYNGPDSYGWALHIVDVTDPASPTQLGVYQTSGAVQPRRLGAAGALAVRATGDFAFLVLWNDYSSGRIEIVDLRTPSDPQLAATYDIASTVNGVTLHGQYLLVCKADGLLVLDVSNPAAPQAAGSYSIASAAFRVAASGTRAYVTGRAGFQVLDLSDPAHPALLGVNTNLGPVWDSLAASGNFVYGTASGSGVQVMDVSNPTNPRLVGGNSAVLAGGLAISGTNIFVAGRPEGLQVFDLTLAAPSTPPVLKATRSGSTLTLSWPASVTGAVLETTSQLPPAANWSPAAEAPVIVGDQIVVTIQIGTGSRFFRLKKP